MLLPLTLCAATEKTAELFGEKLSVNFFDLDVRQQEKIYQQLLLNVKAFASLGEEINQLNKTGLVNPASTHLLDILQLCDQWEKKSELAFSCRSGGLTGDWERAAEKRELPDRSDIRKKAREFLQQHWTVTGAQVAFTSTAKNAGFAIATDGLLQGFVVDTLMDNLTEFAIRQHIDLHGLQLTFGNLQRCWNKDPSTNVCLLTTNSTQFPELPAVRFSSHAPALTVIDRKQDLQKIGPYSLSKILTPREGWPVEFAPSIMVASQNAVTAAATARSLAVKPIAAGISWIESLPGTEVLVMTEANTVFASKGWYASLIADATAQPLWPGEKQFLIEYQTLEQSVAEYRRPYVAVWITDTERQSIRQLIVHGTNVRWLKEISSWWRRFGRANESAIDGLARATTAPGLHRLNWDGRDDKGRAVPGGKYILHIEAAREHGEHELLSLPFELTGTAFDVHAKGEKELGVINIRFTREP